MNTQTESHLELQIQDALNRMKWKKACYFYDDLGYKHFIGVYEDGELSKIRKVLGQHRNENCLSVCDVKTTEPSVLQSLNRNFRLELLYQNKEKTVGLKELILRGIADLENL